MEILQSLYQKRLNSLAHSFFGLLQQLEKSISPFSEPQLTHHRIDYLTHIITTTLENDRQRFIKELFEEIQELKQKLHQRTLSLNEQPMITSKALSRNSTCSRESQEMKEILDHKYQSNGFQNSKKQQSRNPSTLEQTYFENEASMCESTVTTVLKKRGVGSKSQTMINFENDLKSKLDFEPKKQDNFQFKYLRIGKC